MNWIDKLERKYGRYGIRNLTVYMIICYVVGYMLMYISPSLLRALALEPAYILRGQVWRLVTWLIYPPQSGGVFWFTLAMLLFYYPIGTSLERMWGSFRYTLYILMGILFTIVGAFLLYFILGGNVLMGGLFSTTYISLSIFLAYAMSMPDARVYLYFIIPIKMSWMAIVYFIYIGFTIVANIAQGTWYMVVPIVASLLNFAVFYFSGKNMSRYNPKEIRRRQEFRKAMQPQGRVSHGSGQISKHKCAICGRTELDDPNLEFRFCSKCNGNYEYCSDHLFTHTHVK